MTQSGWMYRRTVNPSGLIYGVLAIATVIAAESTRRETFSRLLAASLVTLALYWVAHAYSHHWGSRLDDSSTWSGREILDSLAHETPILAGAALPIAVLVVAWATGASKETAVTAVLWSAVAELAALEVVPGLRHRLRPRELVVQSVAGIVMGVGVLALRVLLH